LTTEAKIFASENSAVWFGYWFGQLWFDYWSRFENESLKTNYYWNWKVIKTRVIYASILRW
jgi:hypothetical protein